jgi:hypothetical protein
MHSQVIQVIQDKRISINDLLLFIKDNSSIINAIGSIDLNITQDTNIVINKHLDCLTFQNIEQVSWLPENLASIFDLPNEKYLHAGVLKTYTNKNNFDITLYSSTLTCIKQQFLSQPNSYQIQFLTIFLERFKLESKGKFDLFGYKEFKWGKTDLYNDINNGNVGKNVIKYLCDYLHINIFILDIANDELHFCNGQIFVPYKPNIFLIRYQDGTFEPFFNESVKTMGIADKVMQKIINNKNLLIPFNFTNALNIDINIVDEDLTKYKLKVIQAKAGFLSNFKGKDDVLTNNKEPEIKINDREYDKDDREDDKDDREDDKDDKEGDKATKEENEENVEEIINDFDDENIIIEKSISEKSMVQKENKDKDVDIDIETGIWVKKEVKKQKNLVNLVSMKMKLDELKTLAKKYKILLTHKVDNKTIAKTKIQLYDEIIAYLKNE